MKTKSIVTTAAAIASAFAQLRANSTRTRLLRRRRPAHPAAPESPHDKRPKVPVTFLGVETSEVPRVLSEQLGLARGFGLVVDYVVPDGPAAAAGVKESDILKMLNDQILTEPDQLSKLIRSFPEGTNVTLTILRKGAESKVPVRLGKARSAGAPRHEGFQANIGTLATQTSGWCGNMEDLKDMGNSQKGSSAMRWNGHAVKSSAPKMK